DRLYRQIDCLRPLPLVGAEHDSAAKPRVEQGTQVGVEGLPWKYPRDGRHICVHVRVLSHQGYCLAQERISGILNIEPKIRMRSYNVFEKQWVPKSCAESWHGRTKTARVDKYWKIEFVGQRKVRLKPRIVWRHGHVLRADLSHGFESAASVTTS